MKKKTLLEELAAERTRVIVGRRVIVELEREAERMAGAFFNDPVIRPRLRALVAQQFSQASGELLTPTKRRNGRKRR